MSAADIKAAIGRKNILRWKPEALDLMNTDYLYEGRALTLRTKVSEDGTMTNFQT